MKKYLSKDIVEDIANNMGVLPSFVEKDYYAVKVLDKLSSFSCLGFNIVFSGGTSLSKGYKLIERFSEDLDFNLYNTGSLNKTKRQTIRHAFRNAISEIEGLSFDEKNDVITRDEGKKEKILVHYPKLFETPNQLRSTLQIEIFFDDEVNEKIEVRSFNSFIGDYIDDYAENVSIRCNHPFNIIADKFNAITWRIYKEGDFIKKDYTLMRHLHDLCALSKSDVISVDDSFKNKVLDNFDKKDKNRVKDGSSFVDMLKSTIEKLETLDEYRKGYEQFVDSMSYASDNRKIKFEDALENFQLVSKMFL